jgi:HemY protein
MIRIVAFLLVVLAAAAGLNWLADRPGTIVVEWQGYIAETSVFRAFVVLVVAIGLAVLAWSALRWLWSSPGRIGRLLDRRRQRRGLGALSSGMIAIGAGDCALAMRYAGQARKALPHEPLTHLLRAQTAQLTGDRATSRRIFEGMLSSPDTEQLGLRGLFLEAERESEREAARQIAERALKLNPKLAWPVEALFDLQCWAEDWQGALDTLAIAQRNHLVDKTVARRRRAVLFTAQAQAVEDTAADKALELARAAHRLAPDLVPAAAIAGRVLAAQGNTPRAARVLLKAWRLSPHPDLAAAYAYARPGDSPRDRLHRMRHLARLTPHDSEGPIAFAITAIEAHEWDEARAALEPLLADRLTQRVATLMARIEGEQHADAGRVREWLARAVNAPRDPAWTADGVVSDRWAPVSPVTGALDAFRWRVPVEAIDKRAGALLSAKMEALVGLGAGAPALARAADGSAAPVTPAEAPTQVPTQTPNQAPTQAANQAAIQAPPQATPSPTPAPSLTPALALGPSDAPACAATSTGPIAPMTGAPGTGSTASATELKDCLAPTTEAEGERQLSERVGRAVPRAIAAPAAGAGSPANATGAKGVVANRPQASPRRHTTVEPMIFVSPRAPDDPGLETEPGAHGVDASGSKA